jgi:hypothetical protein
MFRSLHLQVNPDDTVSSSNDLPENAEDHSNETKFEVSLLSSWESVNGSDRKFLCLYVKKGRRIMDHQRV